MINFKLYDFLNTVAIVNLFIFYTKHDCKSNLSTNCTYLFKKGPSPCETSE